MVKEAICSAATIEQAREDAIRQLNAPEDAEVSFEVLEMPTKKTFGLFGGSPAKVRAFYEESPHAKVETYIRNIVSGLGINDAKITFKSDDESLAVAIDCGENYGTVIGRRGETLDSIQYLTRILVNKGNENYKRVSINVGNYRERREATLISLAEKNAAKVKKYGRKAILDPMNPYERRIVHTAIQAIEGVTSHSVGSDDDRKVVIALAEGFKPTNASRRPAGQSGGGYNRDNNRPRGNNNQRPYSRPNQGQTNSRTPRSDAASTSLYGKIEPKK